MDHPVLNLPMPLLMVGSAMFDTSSDWIVAISNSHFIVLQRCLLFTKFFSLGFLANFTTACRFHCASILLPFSLRWSYSTTTYDFKFFPSILKRFQIFDYSVHHKKFYFFQVIFFFITLCAIRNLWFFKKASIFWLLCVP